MTTQKKTSDEQPQAAGGTPVTVRQITGALRDLGMESGDLVLVSSSLDSLDWIEGGAKALIDALLMAVGPEGTVAMHVGRHIMGRPRPLFDPQASPSEMGVLSDAFWRRPDAKRSSDPAGSVAAIGPLAAELTKTHDGDQSRDTPWGDRAFGKESPWQRLYE